MYLGVRVPPATMAAVDQWADRNKVARSEAIRRLLDLALDAPKPRKPRKK